MAHQLPTLQGIIVSDPAASVSTVPERDSSGDLSTVTFRSTSAGGVRSAGHLYLGVLASAAGVTIDETTYNSSVVAVDATAASRTYVLPALAASQGKVLFFKKSSGTNNLVLDGNAAETIDGAATKTSATAYAAAIVIASASDWLFFPCMGTWT